MRFAIFRTSGPTLVPVGVAATIVRFPDAEAHPSTAALNWIRRSSSQPDITSDLTNRLAKGGSGECARQGNTSWVRVLRSLAACCGRTA